MRPTELNPLFASAAGADRHRPAPDRAAEEGAARCRPASPSRACSICCGTCRPASSTGAPSRRSPTAVPGTIATLEGARPQAQGPRRAATRERPTRSRARTTPAASISCSSTPSTSSSSASSPSGEERYVSGRIERYGETLQMTHPDYIVAPEQRDDLPMLEPVYPLTAGLSGKILLKAARQALERAARGPRVAGADLARSSAAGPASSRRCSACTGRPMPPTSRPARCPGSGSPTTSCSRASSRSRSCGRASRRQPGRRVTGDGRIRARDRRRAALRADALAARGRCARSRPTWQRRAACCGCCRATSARARRWSRCWPWRSRSKPARRPR